MGPPHSSLSIDEERAAARARKFGMISKPLPPSAPTGPSAQVKAELLPKADAPRAKSPVPDPRRASPPPRTATRRSGSVESRVSDRSKREAREREDRDRDRDRLRESRGKEPLASRENGIRSRTPSDRKPSDEVTERRRQEDLLQARHEKLATEEKKVETRRSSRDGHRRETEKERDERKAKERERDKEADREKDKEKAKDRVARESEDAGLKRKRDEVGWLGNIRKDQPR